MAILAACAANGCYANPFTGKRLQLTSISHNRSLRRRSTLNVTRAQATPINPSVRKEEPKVVDNVPVANLSKPVTAYCRCWRSGTFPLCDGSHAKHNKETGDNVGPLLLKK